MSRELELGKCEVLELGMAMAPALFVSVGKEGKTSSGWADASDSGPALWEEMARSELTPEIMQLDVLPEEGH